jgi:hypothetical protein
MQHSDLSKNEVTCRVRNWTLHRHPFNRETFERFMGPGWEDGMLPMVMTGEVIEDIAHRFYPGQSMVCTVIFEVDFFTMRIKTRNSIYQLDGPGMLSQRMPTIMEFDVGNAIMALGVYKDGVQGVIDAALGKKNNQATFDATQTGASNIKGDDHE